MKQVVSSLLLALAICQPAQAMYILQGCDTVEQAVSFFETQFSQALGHEAALMRAYQYHRDLRDLILTEKSGARTVELVSQIEFYKDHIRDELTLVNGFFDWNIGPYLEKFGETKIKKLGGPKARNVLRFHALESSVDRSNFKAFQKGEWNGKPVAEASIDHDAKTFDLVDTQNIHSLEINPGQGLVAETLSGALIAGKILGTVGTQLVIETWIREDMARTAEPVRSFEINDFRTLKFYQTPAMAHQSASLCEGTLANIKPLSEFTFAAESAVDRLTFGSNIKVPKGSVRRPKDQSLH
jgi:hypothetical protein